MQNINDQIIKMSVIKRKYVLLSFHNLKEKLKENLTVSSWSLLKTASMCDLHTVFESAL